MVLRVHWKVFKGLPAGKFSFRLPPDLSPITEQYGTVEFRSVNDEDTPGVKRVIAEPDPTVELYNALSCVAGIILTVEAIPK